jgi:hypothetical protein
MEFQGMKRRIENLNNDFILKKKLAAQLIVYARKKKRGIITIHPDTPAITPITIKAGSDDLPFIVFF